MATPQDAWPKYVALDRALKISERAAREGGLDDIKPPHSRETMKRLLMAAYWTLHYDQSESNPGQLTLPMEVK